MLNSTIKKVGYCFCIATFATHANALLITEIGDAGHTIATAQALPVGTTQVNGVIDSSQDTDLFRFSLTFDSLVTIDMLFPDEDANLLLFNSLGQGIAADDDNDSDCTPISVLDGLDSCLTLQLAAGDYFIGVGDNNVGAFATEQDFINDNDFFDNDNGILTVPTIETLGRIGPEGGPNDNNDTGPYTINIAVASVPEPNTLAILAAGLLGLRWSQRKTKA